MIRSAPCAQRKVPRRLMAITRSHSSALSSKMLVLLCTPAQVTRPSSSGSSSCMCLKARARACGSAISAMIGWALPPAAWTALIVSSALAASTSRQVTVAPCWASARAIVRPSPLPAPVTKTDFNPNGIAYLPNQNFTVGQRVRRARLGKVVQFLWSIDLRGRLARQHARLCFRSPLGQRVRRELAERESALG